MLLIVLLVIFVADLFLWILVLVGAVAGNASLAGWLPFIACVILGVTVFLLGSGAIVWPH